MTGFTVTDEAAAIEAAAKAACEFAYPPTSPDGRVKTNRAWDEVEDWEQDAWRGTARAALEAAARTAQHVSEAARSDTPSAPALDREAVLAALRSKGVGTYRLVSKAWIDAHLSEVADAILALGVTSEASPADALVPQPTPVVDSRRLAEVLADRRGAREGNREMVWNYMQDATDDAAALIAAGVFKTEADLLDEYADAAGHDGLVITADWLTARAAAIRAGGQ